jgi:predicted secreted protein with PEFG-CTERM motif
MLGAIIVQEVHADDNAAEEAADAEAAEQALADAAALADAEAAEQALADAAALADAEAAEQALADAAALADAEAAEQALADAAALADAEAAEQALADAAADVVLTVGISYSEVMGGTQVELEFDALHVNYELTATQNGEVVFPVTEQTKFHSMDLIATHQIDAVGSDDNPINVKVVSLGIGAPDNEANWTGPVGQVTEIQVVPEFGTIAMMVLAVAIISIVAVTAKSRVVPRF